MVLHVEEDGHTYNDPDNDTVLDSYGNKTPSTVMVLGAYVKKRRDTFIDVKEIYET